MSQIEDEVRRQEAKKEIKRGEHTQSFHTTLRRNYHGVGDL